MTVEAIAVDPAAAPGGGAASFRDTRTGCTVHATTPVRDPDLWGAYLDGALRSYRHFGVEDALDYAVTRTGASTALFYAVTDPAGTVIGGVRIQGPYRRLEEVGSMAAWRDRPGETELVRAVAPRLAHGMVEARGAWVARDVEYRRDLGAVVSRCIAHAPRILGVRFCFATVASFTTARHRGTGGVVLEGVPAVAYPDERYRTVPICWDACAYRVLVDPQQYALLAGDWRELGIAAPQPDRSGGGRGWEVRRSHAR